MFASSPRLTVTQRCSGIRPLPALLIGLLAFASGGLTTSAQAAPARRPNVVFILCDDLGACDLACYGADLHETPRLDRLAMQGVRFTAGFASSSVCTPTRAAIMTGKHPARLGMTIWAEAAEQPPKPRKPQRLIPPKAEHNLELTETSIATYLHRAGYQTALVGKWHLGDAHHYPETHGFDINIGGTCWGAPQTFFWPYSGVGWFGKEFRYVPHLEGGKSGEHLTDRLTDEALHVIDTAGDRPFFLYLSHHAPHTPIEAKPEDVAYFERKVSDGLHHHYPTYAAMVKEIDDSVGRVTKRLEERGLADNTIVIFTSDNGGFTGHNMATKENCTDNWPLRSGKGSLYEGGVRVPFIVRWPGVVSPQSVSNEPVSTTDLFYTLLAATGAAGDAVLPTDGLDLAPVLKDPQARLDRDALYFHYPHYYETTTPVSSVRTRRWKLLEYYEDGRRELYDLQADPSEERDLAATNPAEVERLTEKLHAWRSEVGARLPTPNPAWQPPVAKKEPK